MKRFVFPVLKKVNWFPGHMAKGVRVMSRRLENCDCVLTVHDARIPLTGLNPLLKNIMRARPNLLVLNKMDLAQCDHSLEWAESSGRWKKEHMILTNCIDNGSPSVKELMQTILRVCFKKGGEQQETEAEAMSITLMVIGLPNVGKSSVINALRRNYLHKGKAAPVGKLPGVTRAVQGKIKVSRNPEVYVLDTPGVMLPSVPSTEVAFKLALAGVVEEHLVGPVEMLADYLLFLLNQHNLLEYVEFYRLSGACEDIDTFLLHAARRLNAFMTGGLPDTSRAARDFLLRFRRGKLGLMTIN